MNIKQKYENFVFYCEYFQFSLFFLKNIILFKVHTKMHLCLKVVDTSLLENFTDKT